MQDIKFTMRESDRQNVLKWLSEFDKFFFTSSEYYELKEYERDIVGVVCAVFARYLLRLQRMFLCGQEIMNSNLHNCFLFLEKLAKSKDPEVLSLLKDEIFENLDGDERCQKAFFENMGPNSKIVWNSWNKKHRGR